MAATFFAAAACAGTGFAEREPELLERAATDLLGENYSSAAFRYEQFLRLNPETPKRAWVLSQVGLCRNGQGDYEGALREFDQALRAAPEAELELQIFYRRAIAYNFLDRPESALLDLEKVENAAPNRRQRALKTDEFLRILGVTAIRAGHWSRGQKALRELVERHAESTEAAVARPLLTLRSFCVQVAGCPDAQGADGKISELKSLGVVARSAVLPDRPGVVVLVGDYARYPDAVHERERLQALGVPGFILP